MSLYYFSFESKPRKLSNYGVFSCGSTQRNDTISSVKCEASLAIFSKVGPQREIQVLGI